MLLHGCGFFRMWDMLECNCHRMSGMKPSVWQNGDILKQDCQCVPKLSHFSCRRLRNPTGWCSGRSAARACSLTCVTWSTKMLLQKALTCCCKKWLKKPSWMVRAISSTHGSAPHFAKLYAAAAYFCCRPFPSVDSADSLQRSACMVAEKK